MALANICRQGRGPGCPAESLAQRNWYRFGGTTRSPPSPPAVRLLQDGCACFKTGAPASRRVRL